jgi:protein tyrosine/serine phosphatase
MYKFSVLLLVQITLLSGCMTTPALPEHQRPAHWGQVVQNEYNFYQISDFVYRSEQPNLELAQHLKAHHIERVINLRSRHKDPTILDPRHFELVHLPIHTWALNREDLLDVMKEIQYAQQHDQKVLLHCYHGSDRTGASVAMYRIIFEQWSIEDALREMKYGGYGFHPIWRNIETVFSPENVKWIQEQLKNPSIPSTK